MNEAKRRKLERAGWTVGSAADFLELSPEEARYVEMKLALTDALRTRRAAKHLTQTALAKQLGSSQSRVAKMEAGDRGRGCPGRTTRKRHAFSACRTHRPVVRRDGRFCRAD